MSKFSSPILQQIFPTRKPSTFPSVVDESLSLGLDIGIGSCGHAVISLDPKTSHGNVSYLSSAQQILSLGVRAFDVPEDDQTKQPKNLQRRAARLARRQIRRRAQRLNHARQLLKSHGLLPTDYSPKTYGHEKATPIQWRVEGLDRLLTPREWACVLIHFIKHRGFKSNSKSDKTKGKADGTLASTLANHNALSTGSYRSFAEMLTRDTRFIERKRNTSGSYLGTALRDDLLKEVRLLFQRQRELGNAFASPELEVAHLSLLTKQLPLQNSIGSLGDCPFLAGEKRGALAAPSFELSRALQKLNTIHIVLPGRGIVRLRDWISDQSGDCAAFIREFGSTASITWKKLRQVFGLPEEARFRDLPLEKNWGSKKKAASGYAASGDLETIRQEAEKKDFVSGGKSCAHATNAWRKVLGEDLFHSIWQDVASGSAKPLDDASFVISFYEALDTLLKPNGQVEQPGILDMLRQAALPPDLLSAIKNDLHSDDSKLIGFKGAASISSEATRRILAPLADGHFYSDACAMTGFQHTHCDFTLAAIRNPVVKSVVIEVMKQVVFLVGQLGRLPGSICVELARDLGKSVEERNEIQRGLENRTNQKNAHREILASHMSCPPDSISDEDLTIFEHYLEQSAHCPYSFEELPPPEALLRAVRANELQVDHILPFSRSFDNSFHNKVLVYTRVNQQKTSHTPFEWIGQSDPESRKWREYVARLQSALPAIAKQKRRNLLNTTFSGSEDKFKTRHLNDTRYISRIIHQLLKALYEEAKDSSSSRRVFLQPGPMTAIFRKAWGMERFKKDIDNQRIGDKHHAVDALVCACLSEGQRQFVCRVEKDRRAVPSKFFDYFAELERVYSAMELQGRKEGIPRNLLKPWESFLPDVQKAMETFHVSRRENRSGGGAFHDATIYSWRGKEHDEKGRPIYYSRTRLNFLDTKGRKSFSKKIPLVRGIEDPRNGWLKVALEDWCDRGCTPDDLPRGPVPAGQAKNPDYVAPAIKSVWIRIGYKAARPTPHGAPLGVVIGGDIVRLDIFSKLNRRGTKEYVVVPIYTYHLAESCPPNRAIIANKPEEEWEELTDAFTFEFSLWKNSIVKLQKANSTSIGYYCSCDRTTASIRIRNLDDSTLEEQISIKQGVKAFQKFCIDRLGQLHLVPREERTWRGKTLTRQGRSNHDKIS